VVTLDTNVLVRLLVGDDPAQTRLAERTFLEHTGGDGVFVPIVVLVETAWVLAQNPGVMLEALIDHANGTADLADYVIRASASSAGALPVLTFDRKLAREEDVELLVPGARAR